MIIQLQTSRRFVSSYCMQCGLIMMLLQGRAHRDSVGADPGLQRPAPPQHELQLPQERPLLLPGGGRRQHSWHRVIILIILIIIIIILIIIIISLFYVYRYDVCSILHYHQFAFHQDRAQWVQQGFRPANAQAGHMENILPFTN